MFFSVSRLTNECCTIYLKPVSTFRGSWRCLQKCLQYPLHTLRQPFHLKHHYTPAHLDVIQRCRIGKLVRRYQCHRNLHRSRLVTSFHNSAKNEHLSHIVSSPPCFPPQGFFLLQTRILASVSPFVLST
jgi:hypothetical protein